MSMHSGQPYRVLVVEDQDLMRLAMIRELKAVVPISLGCIVYGAGTLEMAIDLLRTDNFDLIVIDPGLPGFDPTSKKARLSVVEQIVEASPTAIHIVVTGSDTIEEWHELRQRGAAAYLGKTGLNREVIAGALQEISAKGTAVHLSEVQMTTTEYHYSGLTPREQEILDWMRRRPSGMKRKDIYEQMGMHFDIDAGTVEKYYKQARAKLMRTGALPKGV
ncbi:DNA-binding response regulator [Phyllobacterium phragmitis]|uniref:DNA-binding response regulator n=1 Tax=Phyllobacterium phragmitis TaxID=2670329 RepID=A0A2S9IKV1_9HYPH|nr:response regulator transcription factor [Phyllobacterium phragmitis]PRD41135.1 DNA-binding response regulator [Phyllobacterium phragmitis]